jgi:hypothetical protein
MCELLLWNIEAVKQIMYKQSICPEHIRLGLVVIYLDDVPSSLVLFQLELILNAATYSIEHVSPSDLADLFIVSHSYHVSIDT